MRRLPALGGVDRPVLRILNFLERAEREAADQLLVSRKRALMVFLLRFQAPEEDASGAVLGFWKPRLRPRSLTRASSGSSASCRHQGERLGPEQAWA